ncbi:MAG: choice-of-anchor X domain-containing protein [Candidatus Hydrogenedens sp.]
MRKVLCLSVFLALSFSCFIHTEALELTLSVTGTIDEIAKVLDCLKQSGLGASTSPIETDPFRVHIYSSSETAKEEVKESISIGFTEIKIAPEYPTAGTPLKLSAKITDTLNIVDTVSVNIFGTSISFDLKDDGQNGDEVAGDGLWTGNFNLPSDVIGNKTFILTAFDARGKIIQLKMDDGTFKPILGVYEFIIQSPEKKEN